MCVLKPLNKIQHFFLANGAMTCGDEQLVNC